jgi:hypothetical protein
MKGERITEDDVRRIMIGLAEKGLVTLTPDGGACAGITAKGEAVLAACRAVKQ